MIPQAGSAYAYSYATLGELVAWIIGWDLILEYAVGNVAVAISWGDYFTTLLRGFGLQLPVWMTTGYRTALLSSDPQIHGLLDSAPHVAGIPVLVHVPAFGIVMVITWLLLRGARESATANNIMVVIKLMALTLFVALWALIGDAAETYDLTNIGTLFAFMLVSIGVLVLRHKEPERPRPFRVPFVWPVCLLSAAGCVFIMYGLPRSAWERFGIWLVIGLVLYFAYGYNHSKLRRA